MFPIRLLLQTSVAITVQMVHMSPEIFKSPSTFDPYRWLAVESRELHHWLVPFSRGPRACMGKKYVKLVGSIIDGTTC